MPKKKKIKLGQWNKDLQRLGVGFFDMGHYTLATAYQLIRNHTTNDIEKL